MGEPASRRGIAIAGAALLALLVAGALAYFWMRPAPAPKVSNFIQLTHDGQPKFLIGTEGSRLYLYLQGNGYQGMAEMSTSGGEPRKLSVFPFANVTNAFLSPDGSELLLIDGHGMPPAGPLWTVPMLGGSPRQLEDLVAQDAAWSADGKSVVYSNGNTLFAAKADGSDRKEDHHGWRIRFHLQSGLVARWEPFSILVSADLATPSYFMEVSLGRRRLASLAARLHQSSQLRVLWRVDCGWKVLPLLEERPNMGVTAKGWLSSLGIQTDSVDFQPDASVCPAAEHRR